MIITVVRRTYLVLLYVCVLGYMLDTTSGKQAHVRGAGGRRQGGKTDHDTSSPAPPSSLPDSDARVGGSSTNNTQGTVEHSTPHPWLLPPKPDNVQVGCKELRSKRYISDGFCTSVKPIGEVVCMGHCLPIRILPWYAEFLKVWSKKKYLEWRCVDDEVRKKRVRLHCDNGEIRIYKIRVVKSCRCKRFNDLENRQPYHRRQNGGKNRDKFSDKRRKHRRRNRPGHRNKNKRRRKEPKDKDRILNDPARSPLHGNSRQDTNKQPVTVA